MRDLAGPSGPRDLNGDDEVRGIARQVRGNREEVVEVDPVCGMEVDPQTPAAALEYKRKTYYFCSPGCLEDFTEDPESFVQ